MGWFDDVCDAVSDVATSVIDTAADVAEAVGTGVAEAAGGVASVAGVVVDVATSVEDAVIDPWADPFLDVASSAWDYTGDPFLDLADDVVFDTLDTATLGLIDIDYDNGNFSYHTGIDGVGGWGVKVGRDGVGGDYSAAGLGGGLHLDDTGIGVNVRGGVDITGMAYVDAGANIANDGMAAFDARAQGYLPTPAGLVGGEAEGHYHQTDEGFDASGSVTARYISPAGQTVAAGVDVAYSEDSHGHRTDVGIHGDAGQLGGPRVYGRVGYMESERDGVSTEGVTATVAADVYGAHADAGVGVYHQDGPEGESTTVETHANVSAYGASAGGSTSTRFDDDGSVETTVQGHVDVDTPDYDDFQGAASTAGYDLPDLPSADAMSNDW